MWTHIDSAWSEGNRLDLYERNGLHMIRVDGWELMNGEYHASEDQLGRLAGLLSNAPHPEILVGGLGLGYTLASLLETLRLTRARITVAERSSAVLRWFGDHVNPLLAATLSPAVRLVKSDVAAHLGVDRRWDVIVLDVDNGPEALSTTGNAVLYVLSREPLSSADRDRVGLEGSSTAPFDPKRAFAPGSGFQSYP
jgi:spermidine synthase